MFEFTVHGPFEIKPTILPHGHQIDSDSAGHFWSERSEFADAVGCYIFGLRTGGGITPMYVGQAGHGFRHECFQPHKLQHYTEALLSRIGTPVMFFVRKESGPAGSLISCLNRVEAFLIQEASHHNPNLLNVQVVEWSIRGIFHSGAGKLSTDAAALRQALGLFLSRPSEASESSDGASDLAPQGASGVAANIVRPG